MNSTYTKYLPTVYQKNQNESEQDYFLGCFLRAYEDVLSETGDKSDFKGIHQLLDNFHLYFDPELVPSQFLSWLASWIGIELEENEEYYGKEDFSEVYTRPAQLLPLFKNRSSINRSIIGKSAQLYKKRGTKSGLLELLKLYAGEESSVSINEYDNNSRIGQNQRIGINTMTGNVGPCYFSIHAVIPAYNPSVLENKLRILKNMIHKEKPFYVNYNLSVEIPYMGVGVYSTVGKETLLGGMQVKN